MWQWVATDDITAAVCPIWSWDVPMCPLYRSFGREVICVHKTSLICSSGLHVSRLPVRSICGVSTRPPADYHRLVDVMFSRPVPTTIHTHRLLPFVLLRLFLEIFDLLLTPFSTWLNTSREEVVYLGQLSTLDEISFPALCLLAGPSQPEIRLYLV